MAVQQRLEEEIKMAAALGPAAARKENALGRLWLANVYQFDFND